MSKCQHHGIQVNEIKSKTAHKKAVMKKDVKFNGGHTNSSEYVSNKILPLKYYRSYFLAATFGWV